MNDLVTFIRSQLDEDERVAKKIYGDWDEESWREVFPDGEPPLPRLQAEVDAKRAILDLYEDSAGKGLHPSAMAIMIRVVAQMVRPYAHRDGFREEWR
jgi:hypothetical protein